MIGYIVYGWKVSGIQGKESDVIKFPDSDDEYIATGSYLHKLFRTKKSAYEQLKEEKISQLELIKKDLLEIDLELSKL